MNSVTVRVASMNSKIFNHIRYSKSTSEEIMGKINRNNPSVSLDLEMNDWKYVTVINPSDKNASSILPSHNRAVWTSTSKLNCIMTKTRSHRTLGDFPAVYYHWNVVQKMVCFFFFLEAHVQTPESIFYRWPLSTQSSELFVLVPKRQWAFFSILPEWSLKYIRAVGLFEPPWWILSCLPAFFKILRIFFEV